jgi:hypothetical protein
MSTLTLRRFQRGESASPLCSGTTHPRLTFCLDCLVTFLLSLSVINHNLFTISLHHNRTPFVSNLKGVCDDAQTDYGSTTNIS